MSATYYGKAACDGFARAAAGMLDVSAQFRSGSPRTDGSTVWLPEIPKGQGFDAAGFRDWCATVWHELAHVAFGTADRHRTFVDESPSYPPDLAAFAYNVIADLADEARLPAHLRTQGHDSAATVVRKAFVDSNTEATLAQWRSGQISPGSPPGRAAGMLALCGNFSFVPHSAGYDAVTTAIKHWRGSMPNLWDCIRAARPARKPPTAAWKGGPRKATDWSRMAAMATALADLLLPLWPKDAADQPTLVAFGRLPSPADLPPGAIEATEAEGEAQAKGIPVVRRPKPDAPAVDQEALAAFRRGMASIVERMRVSSDGGRDEGAPMGRFTRPVRACTDGLAFTAPVVDRTNDRVSACVLLDRSGTMATNGGFAATAAIADALSSELARHCDVTRIAFGERGSAILSTAAPRTVSDFGSSGRGGTTPTAEALALAAAAIKGRPGRRYVIVVTDGIPDDPASCRAACSALVRSGATVLGIALGCPPDRIRESMPGAAIAAAPDLPTLCAGLGVIAARIEAAS